MCAAKFDPVVKRNFLLSEFGVKLSLSHSFWDVQSISALGAVANSNLSTAIECLLVGLDAPAEKLLKRSVEWSEAAIESKEQPDRYFPNGTEAQNFYTLALGRWLLFDEHNSEAYEQFVDHEDLYLKSTAAGKHRPEVSFNLPKYVDARAFARGIDFFECTPRLVPPSSLAIRGELRCRMSSADIRSDCSTAAPRWISVR
jgi:hypothetical protein